MKSGVGVRTLGAALSFQKSHRFTLCMGLGFIGV